MRVEGDSIPADAGEDIEAVDTGQTSRSERPSATADKFARIIEDAQSSTQEFLDTVRRQSASILEEAEEEAQRHRAELIGQAQERLETLISTTDDMLRDAERLQSNLETVSESLRVSAGRLRSQVDELTGSESPVSDVTFDDTDDVADDDELGEEDAQYAPPNRRRFGLR